MRREKAGGGDDQSEGAKDEEEKWIAEHQGKNTRTKQEGKMEIKAEVGARRPRATKEVRF